MTEAQKIYLSKMAVKGSAIVPVATAAKLMDAGYCVKVEGAPSAGRGKATYQITTSGRAALSASDLV